jgi:hypothetical protein
MMFVGQVVLMLSLVTSSGLRVETSTPDALCPELGQVRTAVSARLGHIEGVGEWRASYAIVHRPDVEAGDVVRLELFDPGGQLRLRRDLPRAGESCTAVAQALVVVLDNYFRHPASADGEGEGGQTQPRTMAVAARSAAPAVRPPSVSLVAGVSGGFAAGPGSPAFAIDLRLALRSSWDAGVQAAWLASAQEQELGDVTASLASYAFRGYFARRFRPGRTMQILVGPEVLFQLDRARIPGVSLGSRGLRGGWGAGLRGQLLVQLAPRIAASLLVAADYAPADFGGYFEAVDPTGVRVGEEIFPPEKLRMLVVVGMSVAVFQ